MKSMKSMKVFTLEVDFGFVIGLALAIEKLSKNRRQYTLVLPFVIFQLYSVTKKRTLV